MKKFSVLLILALFVGLVAESASAGLFSRHRRSGRANAQLLIKSMISKDPGMQKVFDNAVGWAVFPKIRKAGMGIGGASGDGNVYRKNTFIGTATMTQISVGFQLGGQVYGEILFFKDDYTLEKFKEGKFELGANVSAIVFDVGVAETADYKDGTMIFIVPQAGLMYEATISGQNFTFKGKK